MSGKWLRQQYRVVARCTSDWCWPIVRPIGNCYARYSGDECAQDLPEDCPLGSREDTLRALANCAKLVGGTGTIEDWGKFDPPLNGEGWRAVDQICEAWGSKNLTQAACYVNGANNVAIISYRGTTSMKGILQDISWLSPVSGPLIRKAVREASCFYLKCEAAHEDKKLYVTGHSLGGFLAEAVASYNDVDGAAFNSPGPWSMRSFGNVTGSCRPDFEVHLTLDDPVAFATFPKPAESRHICKPHWHPGKSHRLLATYMKEIENMQGVWPNSLSFTQGSVINQIEDLDLYPPTEELEERLLEGEVSTELAEDDSDDGEAREPLFAQPSPASHWQHTPSAQMPFDAGKVPMPQAHIPLVAGMAPMQPALPVPSTMPMAFGPMLVQPVPLSPPQPLDARPLPVSAPQHPLAEASPAEAPALLLAQQPFPSTSQPLPFAQAQPLPVPQGLPVPAQAHLGQYPTV